MIRLRDLAALALIVGERRSFCPGVGCDPGRFTSERAA